MHDVLLSRHAVVAADGAGECLAAVGRTSHLAYHFNGVDTFEGESNNGRHHHRFLQSGEEGAVYKMCIMFGKDGIVKLHHLQTCHAEALLFEAADDFADEGALYGAGLEEYQCLLCIHSI